jgi:hypothetical protein
MPKTSLSEKKEMVDKASIPLKKIKCLIENMENSAMSESSLKKDWSSPEEEEAWKDL